MRNISFCHMKLRLLTFTIGLFFVALGLVTAGPVSAASLKHELVVDGDEVLLGDLFDDAGEAAHVVVTAAPAPGKSLRLAAWSVERFAAQNGIDWSNTLRLETLTVHRASRPYDASDIIRNVEDLIRQETGADQLETSLAQSGLIIHLPRNSQDPDIELLSLDRRSGRFIARIDAANGQSYRVAGQSIEMLDVPVLGQPIERGQLITEADLAWTGMRIDRVNANTITSASELIGQAAKRPLRPGLPLRQIDLERPLAVKKGALVTMTFTAPGMTLTDTGRAVDQGAVGDLIAVLNPRSHRTVYGVITGTDAVTVESGSGFLPKQASLAR